MFDLLTPVYSMCRNFVFSHIYPAPSIFSQHKRNFIGVQEYIKLLPNYEQMCHPVKYNSTGEMFKTYHEQEIEHGYFEGMLIGELVNNNFYNKTKHYIIYVGGNTTCYQIFIPEMIALYKKHNKSSYIIGFNPPGVGMSPGMLNDVDEYCVALKSIIDNLCNNGICPENIMVIGHSLGGCVAANTVAKFQHQGKDIKLFADRTMLSIGDAAGAIISRGIPTYFLRFVLGTFLHMLAKLLVRLLKLDIDVATHFKAINERSPGSARGMMAYDDEIMIGCCLSDGLPKEQLQYFRKYKLRENEKSKKSHSRVRSELIHEDGEGNAEQYLDECIKTFAKSKIS